MKTLDQWFAEYAVSHRDPVNRNIHKVCVPAIMWSVFALMWAIPNPLPIEGFRWPYALIACVVVFYFLLRPVVAIAMLAVSALMVWSCAALESAGVSVWMPGLFVFVVAWAAQIWGHKIEGRKPSFLQDMCFLLIGPLWALKVFVPQLFRK